MDGGDIEKLQIDLVCLGDLAIENQMKIYLGKLKQYDSQELG
jgi:hypothetical protein